MVNHRPDALVRIGVALVVVTMDFAVIGLTVREDDP